MNPLRANSFLTRRNLTASVSFDVMLGQGFGESGSDAAFRKTSAFFGTCSTTAYLPRYDLTGSNPDHQNRHVAAGGIGQDRVPKGFRLQCHLESETLYKQTGATSIC